MITIIAVNIGYLIGGTVVIETVFHIWGWAPCWMHRYVATTRW